MMRRSLLSLTLMAAAGAAFAAEPARYGKPLAAGEAVAISAAVAAFDTHGGKAGQFSGRIVEVCQAEGCWMVLEDGGRTARVMFKDHAFLVPKDSSGRARVSGVLSRKALTPKQVAHLREDGKGLAVEPVEYRIVADGVELLPEA